MVQPQTVLLFLYFQLLIGVVSTYFISRFCSIIPYTILLFLIGIIISIVHNFTVNNDSDNLLESLLQWESITPELLLFVLIPPLLFGECMSLNLHYVKKVYISSSLLAIPGAAFSAWLLALFLSGALSSYNWSFTFCWIIGSILCATDPVSIVALMKSHVSTSSQMTLTYLVIGESLLNDGIALVLYEVTSGKKHDPDINRVAYVALYFTKVLLASPLIGITIGWATIFLLKIMNRRIFSEDVVSQIIITISACYLSFYVAQHSARSSGVLSCCSTGIVIAYLAPTLILNKDAMEVIWNVLEWIANTIIFLVSGLIVGSRAFVHISPNDLLSIVIVYLGITAIRILLMLICTPLIKLEIREFSVRDMIFVSFAGLRGPMCLVLVLLLQNHASNSEYYKFSSLDINKASVIICGVVAITNVVNGSLSETVLYSLGIISKNIAGYQEIVLHYAGNLTHKTQYYF